MASNDRSDYICIIIASIMFVAGLILYFVSSFYLNALLCTVVSSIFMIALVRNNDILLKVFIWLLLCCFISTSANMRLMFIDMAAVFGSDSGNYRTYIKIYMLLLLPLHVTLFFMAFTFNKRSINSFEFFSSRGMFLIINSITFKIISFALAFAVLCIGITLQSIDNIFIASPIVSILSVLFVINLKYQRRIISILCSILYAGYALSLQIILHCLFAYYESSIEGIMVPGGHGEHVYRLKEGAIEIGKYTDVIIDIWPISVHKIPLYLVVLPIAIMACLSFLQAVALFGHMNESASNQNTN